MKKAIITGGLILAFVSGNAYAMDHTSNVNGNDSVMTTHHTQVVTTVKAGVSYDGYGRSIGYTPGKANFKSSAKTYNNKELADQARSGS